MIDMMAAYPPFVEHGGGGGNANSGGTGAAYDTGHPLLFGHMGTWPSPTMSSEEGAAAATLTSFDYSANLSSIYGMSPERRAQREQQQPAGNGQSIPHLQQHHQLPPPHTSGHDNIYATQSYSAAPYYYSTPASAWTLPPVTASSPPFAPTLPSAAEPAVVTAVAGFTSPPLPQQQQEYNTHLLTTQTQHHHSHFPPPQQQHPYALQPERTYAEEQQHQHKEQLLSQTSFYTPLTAAAERLDVHRTASTQSGGKERRHTAHLTPISNSNSTRSIHVRDQKAQKAVTIGKATTVESYRGSRSTFEQSQPASHIHAAREIERPASSPSENTASARRATLGHSSFVQPSHLQRSQSLISSSPPQRRSSTSEQHPSTALVRRNGSLNTVARQRFGSRPRLSSPGPYTKPQHRPVRTLSSPIKPLKCAAMRLHLNKLFREPGPKRLGRDVLVVQQNQETLMHEHLPVSSATYDHLPVHAANNGSTIPTQPYTTGWTPQQHYIGHPDDWSSYATRAHITNNTAPFSSDPAEHDYRAQSIDSPRDIWNVPFSSAIPEDGGGPTEHLSDERVIISKHASGLHSSHADGMRNSSGGHQSSSHHQRMGWAKRMLQPFKRADGMLSRSHDDRAWNDYFPEIVESDRVHFVEASQPQQKEENPHDAQAPTSQHVRRKAAPRASTLSIMQSSSPPPQQQQHSLDQIASLQDFLKPIKAGPDLLQPMPSASQPYSPPQQDGNGQHKSFFSSEHRHMPLPPPQMQQSSSRVPSQQSNSFAYGGMATDNVWPPSATLPSSTAPATAHELQSHTERSHTPYSSRKAEAAQQSVALAKDLASRQALLPGNGRAGDKTPIDTHPQHQAEPEYRQQSSSFDDAHRAEVRHVKRVAPRAALSSPPPTQDKRYAIYDSRQLHSDGRAQKAQYEPENEADGASLSQHRSETTAEWRYVRNRAAEKYRDWIQRSAMDLSSDRRHDLGHERHQSKARHGRHMHVIAEDSPRTSNESRQRRASKHHSDQARRRDAAAPPVPPKSPQPDTKRKSRDVQRSRDTMAADMQAQAQASACSSPVDAKELEAKLSKLVDADQLRHKSADHSKEKLPAVQSVESNLTGSRGFAQKMLPDGQTPRAQVQENMDSTFEATHDRDAQTATAQLEIIDNKSASTEKEESATCSSPSRHDKAISALAVSPLLSRIPTFQHLAPDKVAQPAEIQVVRDQGVDSRTPQGNEPTNPLVLESEVVAKLRCVNGDATPRAYTSDLMPAFDSWTSAYRADDEINDDATSDRSLYLEAKLELQQRVDYWQEQVKRNQRRLVYAPSAATSVPASALRGPLRGEEQEKRLSHLTSISRRDEIAEVPVDPLQPLSKEAEKKLTSSQPRQKSSAEKSVADLQANTLLANGKPKAEMTFKGSPSQFIDLIIDSIKLAENLVGHKDLAQNDEAKPVGAEGTNVEIPEHAKRESSTLPKAFMESRACGNAEVNYLVDLNSVVESQTGSQGTRHIQPLSEELSMQLFGDLYDLPSAEAADDSRLVCKAQRESEKSVDDYLAGASCESKPLDRNIPSMSSLSSPSPEDVPEPSSGKPSYHQGHRLRRMPNVSELRKVSNEEDDEQIEPSLLDVQDDDNGLVSSSTGQDYCKPQSSPDESLERSQVFGSTTSAHFVDQFTRKLDAYIESAGDVTHLHKALVKLHHELLEKMSSAADVAVLEHRLTSLEKAFFVPQSPEDAGRDAPPLPEDAGKTSSPREVEI